MTNLSIRVSGLCFVVMLGLAGLAFAETTCLRCHGDKQPNQFFHGSLSESCSSCHGASEAHQKSPIRNKPDRILAGEAPHTQNQACLSCHEGADHQNWTGSAHDIADVSCTSCHAIHGDPIDPGSTETCLGCHQSVKTSLHLPSRHPLLEGLMSCIDCHEPHGTGLNAMTRGVIETDTCTSCHAEKQGPLLFEHEPVTEDCAICHEPHGSVIPGMLKTRPPFLCQQCHQAADHPGQLAFGRNTANAPASALGQSCLNCHGQVHGSNHPSGARLTR